MAVFRIDKTRDYTVMANHHLRNKALSLKAKGLLSLNCGKYFLLTAGYNTCYCNNIAPSETERTCRKVGAHRKEAQGKANRTPAQVEYDRAYNRLKQRKNRKKISVEEWNASVAEAMKVLEQSEQGKINDEEMRKRFEAF